MSDGVEPLSVRLGRTLRRPGKTALFAAMAALICLVGLARAGRWRSPS